MNGVGRFAFPAVVAIGAIIYLASAASPAPDPASGMRLHDFGALPIIAMGNGRTKPFEAEARTKLMLISGRQVFYDDQKQEHSAVEWMLDALTSGKPPIFDNGAVYDERVFRIENDQVLALLHLEPRPGSFRYSFGEIQKKWPEFLAAVKRVEDKKDKDQKLDLFEQKLSDLTDHVKVHVALAELDTPMLVNPDDPLHPRALGDVFSEAVAAAHAAHGDKAAAAPSPFLVMLMAYEQGRAKEFNQALDAYQQDLQTRMPAVTRRVAFEVGFDDFDPFYQCTLLYVGVFLLTILAWGAFALSRPDWARTLNWSALTLGAITLVVHTGALIARMYMMERPFVFVTNLYGTAIFIGWVAGLLGLVFELINRNGIGNFVLAAAGFATMIIAQYLSMGEDTMEMMRAVLDTNFWLATHVTSVNVGYAGTMVAGILGAIFILWGLLTKTMTKPSVKMMGDALYGAVCFATLFSFTGTVLGGLWADYSWGRFWGWDPKENGALMIVVWNALILHARWGGMVKQRGMAVLALVGNIIVVWSWWGVNMLGVGLHAYANADPGMKIAVWSAVAVHVGLITAGLVPLRLWRSFSDDAAAVEPPPPPNGRQQPKRGKTGTGVMPNPA